MNRTEPIAHIRNAMMMPIGMMAFELTTAALLPMEEFAVAFVSSDPQYQRATTYICWVPWMTQARYVHAVTGAPPAQVSIVRSSIEQKLGSMSFVPSSPKFTAK